MGAGPAGLQCAETLGNSKYKVLLIDKKSEIGPKVCAVGLTRKGIDYINLPNNFIDFQSYYMQLHINNFCFNIKNTANFAYTIDRGNLGQWQLKKLNKFDNINVWTKSEVSKITKNFIVVNGQKISYNFLVGADGSSSTVRKYLGIKSQKMCLTFQYIIPAKGYKKFEVFLNSKLFKVGYAWIFPHNDYVSIGCMCDSKVSLYMNYINILLCGFKKPN